MKPYRPISVIWEFLSTYPNAFRNALQNQNVVLVSDKIISMRYHSSLSHIMIQVS